MLIIDKPSDLFLCNIAKKFLVKQDNFLTIWSQKNQINDETFSGLVDEENKPRIKQIQSAITEYGALENLELIVISLEFWNKLKKQKVEWLSYCPSILIVNK